MWTDLSSVLSQCMRVTDGRTDRRTKFSSLDRVCIACSAVKTIITKLNRNIKQEKYYKKSVQRGVA